MASQQPDPSFNAYLAALLALYISAEEALLGGIAGILRFTKPDILSQLASLNRMRALTAKVNRELTTREQRYITPLVQKVIEAGKRDGLAAIGRAGGGPPARIGQEMVAREPGFDFGKPHGVRSVEAIKADLISPLDNVKRRITRLPDDVYKVISPAAAGGQAFGHGYTPAQAQAYAWREFVRRGVTGFTDKSGRDWTLSAYVEMSVRTATMRAYNDSHLQVMQASGIDLFTVSDDGHPCPLCFPWQNVVLSVSPDPRAAATIATATDAGLFHPNCRHILAPYLPGITALPPRFEWTPEMANDYNLTQKQRRLELEIRKAKKTLEYSSDPLVAASARKDVRLAQAKMRAFIDSTGFLRQSRREQLDLANDHLKLPSSV
jgi:hypothetical protein